ncbi:MAG: DNA mismatch repair protein MutS, partial [Chitinophagaceae bacterium]|nr:DNA mismatch repair protein MutS [Chitinophagaceae bacterium]
KENEKLKKELEHLMNKEKHDQQIELLKHQNKISEERANYLKDMERKLKQMILEWRKAEDKNKVVNEIQNLLFKKNESQVVNKLQKKIDQKYAEVPEEISVGIKVKMKKNHQVGEVLEIRGKRAVVKIGLLPMQVDLKDLVAVKEKAQDSTIS